jgi:rhodanese-related sulfurtransferase
MAFMLLPWTLLLCGFFWNTLTWDKVNKDIDKNFSDVPQITTEDAMRLYSQHGKEVFIDVRSREEYEVSHLPEAINIEDPAKVKLAPDTTIIAYCSVGYRSAIFTRGLLKRGFRHAYNMRGSIFEWANKGYPLLRGTEIVHTVHPFNKKWGVLLRPEFHYDLQEKPSK